MNRAEQIRDAKSIRASGVGIHEGAKVGQERVRRVLKLELRKDSYARLIAGLLLKLPPDTMIVSVGISGEYFDYVLHLESRAFPPIKPGQVLDGFIVALKTENGSTFVESVSWPGKEGT